MKSIIISTKPRWLHDHIIFVSHFRSCLISSFSAAST